MKTLVLIDGHNLAFRAYNAVPPKDSADGFPMNALHGFHRMIMNLKWKRPDYMAVCLDSHVQTFRKALYPGYKAHRPPCPEGLARQLSELPRLCKSMGIACFQVPGFEADDFIATLVRRFGSESIAVQVVSTDKDLMQLVSDNVTLVDTLINKIYGVPEVIIKWGVHPSRLRDLFALMGDSSDGISGVPGIGMKTAAKLIQEFGSLTQLYANIHCVSNARHRGLLQTHRQLAELALELVTLCDTVPLTTSLEGLAHRNIPRAQVDLGGFLSTLDELL